MSVRGVVTHCVEPTAGKACVVTDLWMTALVALMGKPCPVRIRIYAAPDNAFPTTLYRRALDTIRAHGCTPVGVVAQDFDAVALNTPLGIVNGQKADPTLNDGIEAFTLRLEGVCRQLVPHGLEAIWLWNEPNLNDQPSVNAPSLKPTSLNPAVFGSLLYQGARRAKAAGIRRVYAGALSCLEQFHTNPAGDWEAGYLDKGLAHLAANGKHDLAVDVFSLNMEGWVDAPYAQQCADAIKAVAAKHGYSVATAVGEWGWANPATGGIDMAKAASTFAALDGAFDETFFYAHQATTPHDPTAFGCDDWTAAPLNDGSGLLGFYPFGAPLPWHDALKTVLAT